MKLKCIAVDDEPLALELLAKFVEQTAFLSLEAKFDNAIQALSYLNQHEVDLAILDIQMPDLSGMELARILTGRQGKSSTKIIFSTAYNQFAIEGYKVDALDYLLKPFSYADFLQACTKAYNFFENQVQKPAPAVASTAQTVDFIFLKVEYQLVKVMLREITHVEALKDYVKVHLTNKPHPLLSLTSLKNMEDMLPADRFMRIHRSFIINTEHIEAITKNTVIIEGHRISISDHYKDNFSEFLNKWTG